MTINVAGKVVIVTGGASGIGRATSLLFSQKGAKVVIADFNDIEGGRLAQEINDNKGSAISVKVDVVNRIDVEAMIKQTIDHFGTIDVLINNAGITQDNFLAKMTADQWQQVVDVNLTGVFNCAQLVIPVMLEKGKGTIINCASVVGVYGNMGQTNYAATKAGVIGMTKSWAKELGPKGINANAVAPGFILTEMTKKVPEKILALMEQKTPIRRVGKPEDVANAYLYLASEEASFINGAILSVDGGLVV